MNGRGIGSILCIVSFLMVICTTTKASSNVNDSIYEPLQSGKYEKKIDNFLIVFDLSGSMSEPYNGTVKFNHAKTITSGINKTIPDINLNGALRILGKNVGHFTVTERVYGLKKYSRDDLGSVIKKLKNNLGSTPLAGAIKNGTKDLTSAKGQIAVIVISDGKDSATDSIGAAKNMKDQFGNRICIYTILEGDDSSGKELMNGIANAGQCGFSVTAESITSKENMATFVKKVFLKEVFVAKTETKITISDSDGDGVIDAKDKCPGTPAGADVNKQGCWVLKNVQFETAKWEILPQYYSDMYQVTTILKKNPSLKIEIQGHTDSRGSDSMNKTLSENRAKAVVEHLVNKGIQADRLSSKGFGLSNPVATNETREGRAQNRRVELHPVN